MSGATLLRWVATHRLEAAVGIVVVVVIIGIVVIVIIKATL